MVYVCFHVAVAAVDAVIISFVAVVAFVVVW